MSLDWSTKNEYNDTKVYDESFLVMLSKPLKSFWFNCSEPKIFLISFFSASPNYLVGIVDVKISMLNVVSIHDTAGFRSALFCANFRTAALPLDYWGERENTKWFFRENGKARLYGKYLAVVFYIPGIALLRCDEKAKKKLFINQAN